MDISNPKKYKGHPWHMVIFSVDLGRQNDFTAWAMCEIKPEERQTTRNRRTQVMTVTVRDLQRLPLGTPYSEVQRRIHEEFWTQDWWLIDEKAGRPQPPQLVIDSGGPGLPVIDNLVRNTQLGRNVIRYVLTSGTARVHFHSPHYFTCPRSILFQQLYATFTDERIAIDPRLEFSETLLHELTNLRLDRVEETGQERVVHREGEHDDLSIAVGAASFLANTLRRKRSGMKLLDYWGSAEIDPMTGLPKRKGRDLRRRAS